MATLTRHLPLLFMTALLAAACGSSNSSELLGPGHTGTGGAAAGGSGGSATGGGDAGIDAAAGSPGSGGTGGTATGGSAGTDGSAGTGGSAGAAGSAGSTGTGGATGTPDVIACAGTPCATQGSVCCTCPNCFPPFPTTCYPKLTGCTTGTPMYCDDTADCTAGHVCCAHFDPKTHKFSGAACNPNCPSNSNAQLCTIDSQCPKGTHCMALASLPGFKACQ